MQASNPLSHFRQKCFPASPSRCLFLAVVARKKSIGAPDLGSGILDQLPLSKTPEGGRIK
jgi:hypothetical protein